MDNVADGTYRLQLQVPGVSDIFSTYLIDEKQGILIEPGPAALIPGIRKALEQLGMKPPGYIIATHIHMDHAGGLGALSELFPAAKILVHPAGETHIVEPSRLIQSTCRAHGDQFEKRYGAILPVPGSRVKVVRDGETLDAGGRRLTLIYTPGHAPHHLAVFDHKVKGLYCGEGLGIPRLSPRFGFQLMPAVIPGFDADAYLDSIERMKKLKPEVLFFSHGGTGDDPDRLMSMVAENTRVLSRALLDILHEEKTPIEVRRRVREFVDSRFGLEILDLYLDMTIDGYAIYFRRKGLL
ncbi:MAG: MBL fold metallo-hydrolase [Desulfobacterales bacterium]|nr:MBL fold metallo-hydrolase [Desulfobacterales bacterium]